jgi:hypothetical protein
MREKLAAKLSRIGERPLDSVDDFMVNLSGEGFREIEERLKAREKDNSAEGVGDGARAKESIPGCALPRLRGL